MKNTSITEEELRDLIFEIKSKFFSAIPHPQLILKYYNQLVSQANINHTFQSEFQISVATLNEFLIEINTKINHLRNDLAVADSAIKLAEIINSIYLTQSSLIAKLSQYYSNQDINILEQIRMSSPYNYYELAQFVKGLSENDEEIKQYICNETVQKEFENWSVLTKSVLQSQKIISHGR